MSPFLSSQESAIKLLFDSRTFVAGERISGVVELDFPLALEDKIEQVRVKLRGTASSRIIQSQGKQTVTYTASLPLARDDTILWTQGTYPPPGTHILQLPFEFQIPKDSPPSFQSSGRDAIISYGIEVVADRPGLFRFNRRIGRILGVLPTATQEQVERAFQIAQGWSGEWKSVEHSREIRKHFWGEYSHVQAQFQYPALDSFPMGIRIPIRLIVTTLTKTMPKSETPDDAFSPDPHKPLFPSPPQGPEDVRLLLESLVDVEAHSQKEALKERLSSLSGFEPVWLPEAEKGEEGKWKREVRFDTTMLLTCPPTFELDIVKCSYELNVEITFPGIGNNLEFNVPIHINSGFGPFDPNAPPPPTLELPPSYFSGGHHDWDGDEKSG